MSTAATPPVLRDMRGVRLIPIEFAGGEAICNPSIAQDGGGFRALIRGVNYVLRPDGRFTAGEGGIQSRMWLAHFDRDLRLTGSHKVDDSEFRHGRAERGFEDARLFRWKGDWWFSATALERTNPVSTSMALCRLDDAKIASCDFIRSPVGHPFEKNWMPLVRGDTLNWIYRISPMQVIRAVQDEVPVFEELNPGLPWLQGWSGSSPCVRYRGRWLCVVHRRMKGEVISYDHAFVEFDDDFRIVRASQPWRFENEPVEFCAGLCFAGDDAILSYGVMDRHARILRLPLPRMEALLQPGLVRRIGTGLRELVSGLRGAGDPASGLRAKIVKPSGSAGRGGSIMPTQSNDEIIHALYNGILDRDPDPSGLANYRARLAKGAKLGELITEFIQSEEFRKRAGMLAAPASNGVQVDYNAVAMKDHLLSGWNLSEQAELIKGFSIGPDDVVVDVGCGQGGKISFCARFAKKVIGIDVDPKCVADTSDKLRALNMAAHETILVDGSKLPLADESADRIICTEVLEHVDDPAIVLGEMNRIGKKGALYVFTVPDSIHEHARKHTSPPSAFQKPNHVRIIERDEFVQMVKTAGLEVRRHLFHGFYQAVRTTLHWRCKKDEQGRHPVLDHWAKTWDEVMKLPDGLLCKQALDDAMPKSQIIIARKP